MTGETSQGGPTGQHAAPGSFDGGQAIEAAGAENGVDLRTAGPARGILEELRALHLSLFDSWLSEDQLGRLGDAAYRAPPLADAGSRAGEPDAGGPGAADGRIRRRA